MTITSEIQVGEGSHLGWRALWLREPEFALALVPDVGGRIMGIEWHCQVPPVHPRPYAHGCVSEVFNSAQHPYVELEMHGPMVELKPGESFALEETVRLEDVPDGPHWNRFHHSRASGVGLLRKPVPGTHLRPGDRPAVRIRRPVLAGRSRCVTGGDPGTARCPGERQDGGVRSP